MLGSNTASWGELIFTISGGAVALLALFVAYRAYQASIVAPSFALELSTDSKQPVVFAPEGSVWQFTTTEDQPILIALANRGNAIAGQVVVMIEVLAPIQIPIIELPAAEVVPTWASDWRTLWQDDERTVARIPEGHFLPPGFPMPEALGALQLIRPETQSSLPPTRGLRVSVAADKMSAPEVITFFVTLEPSYKPPQLALDSAPSERDASE